MLVALVGAYSRRKRWEMRAQAVEMAKALAELFGASEKGNERVPVDEMLRSIGLKVE